MENNNPTPQPQPIEQQTTVVTPSAPAGPKIPKFNFNPKMLWVLGAVLVIIAIALGGYLYTQNQAKNQKTKVEQEQTKNDIDELEKDASGLDIEDIDSAFKEVDEDLVGL